MKDIFKKFTTSEEEKKNTQKPSINVPSVDAPNKTLTLKDLDLDIKDRIVRIQQEFVDGLGFIRKHPKSVTFFGSARFKPEHEYYKKAESIARKIGLEGYDVVTGGGPGIMEAANKGAYLCDECGHSIGFNIDLPMEQILNPYVDKNVSFHYFFTRKMVLTFSAEAYVYFPGGFGTLDEFFEILTLVQTRKIPKVPIICVGNEYWGKLDEYIKEVLNDKYSTISESDMNLYEITEDEDRIVEIVKNAPLRKE